jgi:hypothetical protein
MKKTNTELRHKSPLVGVSEFFYRFKYLIGAYILLIFIVIIPSTITLGQVPQGFNYQAVLRNGSGEIRENENVTVKIDLLQGHEEGDLIFNESHITQTNSFGLVNLVVGSQNPGDFVQLDWSDGPFFIRISVEGQVMGTSQLMSVPFAMYAASGGTQGETGTINWTDGVGNVTTNVFVGIGIDDPLAPIHVQGLGTGEGNVLFTGELKKSAPGPAPISGAGTRMMWYPDRAAFRAGTVSGNQWDADSIGISSMAWGNNSKATGQEAATAWGDETTASSSLATAWGWKTTASAYTATSWGFETTASELYATAWGVKAKATAISATAWGENTTASGHGTTVWGDQTKASGRSATAWGLETTASGINTTAWGQSTTASNNRSTAWGESTIASGEKSTVWGTDNTASGTNSTAWGSGNTSTESYSSVWGQNNQATGVLSTAWGVENEASGGQSTAWGSGTHAAGVRSTAWGYETVAHSANETVLGHFSTSYIPSSQVNIVGTDRLLVLGNGTSNANRSNALTILKNGKTAIGNVAPVTTLHVRHGTLGQNVPPTEGLRLHNSGASNSSWTLYTVNSNGNLQFYANNDLRGTFSASNGAYTSSSNRRLKTDITILGEDILKRTMLLQPVSYRFKSHPDHQPTLGFIAEDVLPVFPELVEVTGETDDDLGVNYAAFSVVAIKAIQEQQVIIEKQET